MKSFRILFIAIILLITTIAPMRANWFTDNKQAVVTGAVVTALAGCVSLGVKLYLAWRVSSSEQSYEYAISVMKEVVADPFANDLELKNKTITQAHLTHYHRMAPSIKRNNELIWVEFARHAKSFVDKQLENARSKNGEKYFPELEKKAHSLYGSFKSAHSTFKATFDAVASFDKAHALYNDASGKIEKQLEFCQSLQVGANPLDILAATHSELTWLLASHGIITQQHGGLVQEVAKLKEAQLILRGYNASDIAIRESVNLMANAEKAITFLMSVAKNIKNHSDYANQVRWQAEQRRHQEELERQRKREEELTREISQLRDTVNYLHLRR